jgi:S1-C subfamily serine protease
VDLKDISDDQVSVLKLKDSHGAEITRVDHDGPAGKMGLRERDVVIQMNGVTIEGEDHIRRMLSATAPGQKITLLISRDGQQLTVSAPMADRVDLEHRTWVEHVVPQAPANALPSDEASVAGSVAQPGSGAPASKYGKSFLGSLLTTPTYTGVVLERVGAQLAMYFGVPNGAGLLVRNVENNSPAAMAGLRAGDVVFKVDSKNVGSMSDWTKVIKEAKGRPVQVVVQRDRAQVTMMLTPDTKKHSELEMPDGQPQKGFFARLVPIF